MKALDKIKASMRIGCLDIKEKINVELSFFIESFNIYFIEPLKEQNIREIKNLFYPFLSPDKRNIKMNYIYIKTIFLDGSNILKFTIYNPTDSSIFTLIFNRFKYKKKLIINSVPSPNAMNNIVTEIKKRNQNQTMKNIKNFINVIYIFYEFRSTGRRYNNIINDMFIKAFNIGIIFYDKSLKEFYLSQEKIKQYPKEKQYKINNDLEKFEQQMPDPEINIENNNNSSDVETEENQIKKNKKIIQKNDISSELELDTITQKDLFQNYPLFNKFPMDLKKMASYFTEITINLLYKLFNVNIEELNKKYDDLNQTVNGRIINKKINIENFNQTDINNLITNIHKSYNNKIIDKNVYEDKIKEWFEFSKEFHSFIPNNSMENIISNTSQIIHRKFFEILIKTFFPDIISIEINRNKTLNSDEFHLILKILRRLKSILFTNKNRKYYLDFEFLNEEQNSYMLFNSSIY